MFTFIGIDFKLPLYVELVYLLGEAVQLKMQFVPKHSRLHLQVPRASDCLKYHLMKYPFSFLQNCFMPIVLL